MNGYLILDKPLNISSAQAVGKVKRLLRECGLKNHKIGHGGTLDPLASGILPLALGEATKTVSYALHGDKAYEFTIRWGAETETDDLEGAITRSSPMRPTETQVKSALPAFMGVIKQMPPAYSALKVDGVRAYALARAGQEVKLAARDVNIIEFQLLDMPDADHARFRVTCGKGTYIRALARDLALHLGTYGHLSALRRTKAGPFGLESAISLENLAKISHISDLQQLLLPIETALVDIPAFALTADQATKLRHGQKLAYAPICTQEAGTTILATESAKPVALCEVISSEIISGEAIGDAEKMVLKPLRVFNLN